MLQQNAATLLSLADPGTQQATAGFTSGQLSLDAQMKDATGYSNGAFANIGDALSFLGSGNNLKNFDNAINPGVEVRNGSGGTAWDNLTSSLTHGANGSVVQNGGAADPEFNPNGPMNNGGEQSQTFTDTGGKWSTTGTTDNSSALKSGPSFLGQLEPFLLAAGGLAAAPLAVEGLAGLAGGGAATGGTDAAAVAAGQAGSDVAAGGLSSAADSSLAQIGGSGLDSVYGTTAAGGAADASGASLAGIDTSGLGGAFGTTGLDNGSSLFQQGKDLYSQASPYKTAIQGVQQLSGLDGGQASTVGSPQGVSGAGGSNSTLGAGGLGGLLSLAGGIYGATQASGNAQAGINIADPNQANQAGYLSQLQNLVNNPSSVNNNAEFQAANKSALAGVNANMAAGGFGGSGNLASALYQIALADQQNFYQQDVTNLEKLGGIDQAQQGTAAQIQQGIGSNVSSLLNGAGQGLSALLGSGGLGGALSSLGSGASSIYNSVFGGASNPVGTLSGEGWGVDSATGEGLTSSLPGADAAGQASIGGFNAAADSVSADSSDISSALSDFWD